MEENKVKYRRVPIVDPRYFWNYQPLGSLLSRGRYFRETEIVYK